MNRGSVKALAVGQAVTAAILVMVVVVFTGQMGQAREEVDALRAELADTRSRLVQAEADRDRLQERVDALTQALLLAGVDPNTVPVEPSVASSPEEGPQPAAPRASAGRSDPPSRPAEQSPAPQPSEQPPPPPPPQEPDPEPSTCVLTVCLPL